MSGVPRRTSIATLIPGQYTFTTFVSSGKLPLFAEFNIVTPGTGSGPGTGIPQLDAAPAQPDPATNPIGALGFGSPYPFNNSLQIQHAGDEGAVCAADRRRPGQRGRHRSVDQRRSDEVRPVADAGGHDCRRRLRVRADGGRGQDQRRRADAGDIRTTSIRFNPQAAIVAVGYSF